MNRRPILPCFTIHGLKVRELRLLLMIVVLTVSLAFPAFAQFEPAVALTGFAGSFVQTGASWGDYNNDGYLDLIINGNTSAGARTYLYNNNAGTSFTLASGTGLPNLGNGCVEWGDYNNDGWLDLFLAGSGASQVWRNNTNGTFTQVATLSGYTYTKARWGDYNNDGFLDLVMTGFSSSGVTKIYRNNKGTGFTDMGNLGLPNVYQGDAVWGDYDNDGDMDVFISGSSISQIYRNDGVQFTLFSTLTGLRGSTAEWGDYDNDGDLDLVYTGDISNDGGHVRIYRNDVTAFTFVTDLAGVRYPGASIWGDMDNDGDLDLAFAGQSIGQIWRNNGGGSFQNLYAIPPVQYGILRWGDYDNDGRLDLFAAGDTTGGGGSGYLARIYRNTGTFNSNTPPNTPTGLTEGFAGSNVILSWNAVTDNNTPAPAINYNVSIGSVSGGVDVVSPHANLTNGFHNVVRRGNADEGTTYTLINMPDGEYYWRVQALDHTFSGSVFSSENNFILAVPPDIPQFVNAAALNGAVKLKWNKSFATDVIKYYVYMDTQPNATILVDSTTSATDTTKILSGLTNDQIYYFRVQAVDNVYRLLSGYSVEDAAVPVVEAGSTLVFDGIDDYVTIPYSPNLALSMSDDFTISAWIKRTADSNMTIFHQSWSSTGTLQIWCEITNTGLLLFGTDNFSVGGWDWDYSVSAVPLNIWTNVAFVKSGFSKNIYINGNLDKTASVVNSGGAIAPTAGMTLGMSGSEKFIGSIDEVQIWKTALNGAQINAIQIKPVRGDESGLAGVWHFDEPQGHGTVYDGTSIGNHGTVSGSPASIPSGAMAPIAPNGVTVFKHEPDSVVVKWNANSENDLSHYIIYRSQSAGFIPSSSDSVGRVDKPGNSFSDASAVPGFYYYYRVTGVDSANQYGAYSAQASLFYGDPLTVYNTNNSGLGSLRTAIDTANARAGADTIRFYSSVKDSTIILLSTITLQSGNGNGTVIDGDIDGDNKPSIILAGTRGNYHGIEIRGNNNTIKNVNMVRHGVFLQSSSAIYVNTNSNFNRIIGNYLGTNLTATDTVNTGNNISITISSSASNNFIGDSLPECRNVISGTSWSGIQLRGSNNYIFNNIIGLNATGTTSMGSPNQGIYVLSGSLNNFIGNGTLSGRNIISGNRYGIYIQNTLNANTRVLGNYIGTDISGTLARGNSQGGIALDRTTYIFIGDGTAGGRNVISGNSVGIHVGYQCNYNVIDGNYIGVAGDGLTALGNGSYGIWIYGDAGNGYATNDSVVNNVIAHSGTGILINGPGTFGHKVFKNSIYNNSGFGINITNGAQEGVLQPVIQFVADDSTVSGYASPGALLQIYADAAEEGRYFLDTTRADGLGNWSKKVTIPSGIQLTALQDSNRNTSMFSLPKSLTALAPTGLSAMAGDRKVQLRWNSNAELDVAKYRIYWGTNPNPTLLQDSTLSRLDTALVVAGLIYGQTYYFRISAVNLIGNESTMSSDASAMPYTKGMVMNTIDAGVGSLRWAIDSANAYPGADTIRFAPILKDSTIRINSSLTLQSGNGNGTVIDGDIDEDGKPSVTITAGSAGYQGIYISGSGNTIKNLNITGFRAQNTAAILIEQGQYNRVVGCFLGTNLAGSDTAGSGNFLGVWMAMSSSNVIGDTVAEGRNVISGNTRGIAITFNSVGNWILGNYIGTDAGGSSALGNVQSGIELSSAAKYTRIGHWNENGRNVIAGSGWYGITVGGGSDSNEIINNYIGTDAGGNYAIPNGTGVLIQTSYNAIGRPYAGNLISGNTNAGIHLMLEKQNAVAGNIIGLNAVGTTAIPNSIGIQLDNTDSVLIGGATPEERNVISGNTNGIMMLNAPHTRIVGNYIGTDIGGASAISGTQHGIWIQNSANHAIGDGTEGGRNIISGNQFGLRITGCDSTSVLGNFFGLDKSGTFAVPNSTAIHLDYSTHTLVGDGTSGGRNIISGNTTGIYFYSSFINGMTNYNWIKGNFIGTDYSGTVAVPNGYGILINDRVRNNVVGDGTTGGRNIISGNSASAVSIWASQDQGDNVFNDNYVGLDVSGNALGNAMGFYFVNGASGDSLINNTIAYNSGAGVLFDGSTTDSNIVWTNSIYQNNGGGISLVNGAQGGLISPVITSILYDSTVTGIAEPFALIHLYEDPLDQGSVFMDSVRAAGDGTWAKKITLLPNMKVTAIQHVYHNSSAFSVPFSPILGTLAATPAVLNTGAVPVGESAAYTIRFFAADGGVIINNIALAGGVDFSMAGLVLPDTLFAGDTLSVDIQLAPTAFSSLTDTILIANNSSVPVFKVALSGSGISGSMASNVDPANFGNVSFGNNASQTIKVYSNGGAVRVSGASIQNGTDFTITNALTFPDTLFAGDTLMVDVQFAPTVFATLTDSLVISNNSVTPVFKVGLVGSGIPGSLVALPPGYDFGNLPVDDSAVTTINFISSGGGVQVGGASLNGGNGYTIISQNGNSLLMDGDTLTYTLKFKPQVFALQQDTLKVTNNSSMPVIQIPLSGVGVSGSLAANLSEANYGNVFVGDISAQTIKLYSTGGAVRISDASIQAGTDFAISNALVFPDTLFTGDTLLLDVQFAPTAFTDLTDTLLVTNNSGITAFKIALHGTGIAGTLAISPTEYDFGNVAVEDSVTQSFRLYATIGSVIVHDPSLDFGLDFQGSGGNFPDTLFAGDTLIVFAKFKPTSFGLQSDTARFSNNSVINSLDVILTGTGVSGSISANRSNVSYGNVSLGNSASQTIKIFSSGGAVRVSGLALQGGTDYTITNGLALPDTLYTGDTLWIDVQFAPTAFTSLADTLVVTNNSGVPVFAVDLSGTGISGTLEAWQSAYDFGNVAVGDSAQLTVKLYSLGGAVRVDEAGLFSGASFHIASLSGPSTLFAGDTMLVAITYHALDFGIVEDSLFITSNSLTGSARIGLLGSGIPGALGIIPLSYDFGNVKTGDSLETEFKLYSTGGAVDVSGLSWFDGTQYSVASTAGPAILFSGDTLKVRVRFKPLTFSPKLDSLIIANNSLGTPLKAAVSGTGSIGDLYALSTHLNFASVQIGDSAVQTIKLYGSSNGIMVSDALLASGEHFTVTSQTLPTTLNIGDTLIVTIHFRPMTFGAIHDTLSVINISVNNPLKVPLSGIGDIGTLTPVAGINFGSVTIGDSLTKVLKLTTNIGAVKVDSLRFDFGTEFSFQSSAVLPDTIFPGDTLSVNVKYRPLTFATTSDTIRIYGNSPQGKVILNGIGNSGTLVTSPAGLNFGNVLYGDSATRRLKVYAAGANIMVSAAALESAGDYSIVAISGLPVTLSAGLDTLTIDVRFKPSGFGPTSNRLIISNNSLSNPVKVNATGTGAAGTLAVTPPVYDFGSVSVNDSLLQTFKIFAATGKVIVNQISLDHGVVYFSTAGAMPDTLVPGDTLTVTVAFKPNTTGILRDTLRIGNNSKASSVNIGLDGTGLAGALTSSASNYDFGYVKAGGRSQATLKFYAPIGQVIISDLKLGLSHKYSLVSSRTIPAVLNTGDSLSVTVTFAPTFGGTIPDTLYAINNSSVPVFGLSLSGIGVVNTPPSAFMIKAPDVGTVVTRTPVFSWEGKGDPDGDVLSYTLQFSKFTAFNSVIQFAGISDSAYTLATPLDSLGTYFWRVSANDNQGGITVSNTGTFHVDAVGPSLYVGVLASTIQPSYIEVYVNSNESLDSIICILDLKDTFNVTVDIDTMAMSNLSGMLYYAPYRLDEGGNLTVSVIAGDLYGNISTFAQDYHIASVRSKSSISLSYEKGLATVNAASGTVGHDGYLLVTRLSDSREMTESLRKTISEQDILPKDVLTDRTGAWTGIGEGVRILSTVPIKKSFTVSMRYTPEDVSTLRERYPDFRESKIGLYREEGGQWVYEGGEGKDGRVTARIDKAGALRLFYDPEHVDFPKYFELSQNYPNPFNPTTTIRFGLPEEGRIKLVIYNILGQKVRELVNESRPAGYQTVVWNGKNDLGVEAASGLYIYRLETSKGYEAKKMLLIK